MTGQDAATTARAFHEALPLTGVILTKADGGCARGRGLSVRFITGQPIKFVGMGEKAHALEPFYPDRILGMGDVLGLIEEVERRVNRQEAEKLAERLKKGQEWYLPSVGLLIGSFP
jgi:signal recognition particle subunit SRP54